MKQNSNRKITPRCRWGQKCKFYRSQKGCRYFHNKRTAPTNQRVTLTSNNTRHDKPYNNRNDYRIDSIRKSNNKNGNIPNNTDFTNLCRKIERLQRTANNQALMITSIQQQLAKSRKQRELIAGVISTIGQCLQESSLLAASSVCMSYAQIMKDANQEFQNLYNEVGQTLISKSIGGILKQVKQLMDKLAIRAPMLVENGLLSERLNIKGMEQLCGQERNQVRVDSPLQRQFRNVVRCSQDTYKKYAYARIKMLNPSRRAVAYNQKKKLVEVLRANRSMIDANGVVVSQSDLKLRKLEQSVQELSNNLSRRFNSNPIHESQKIYSNPSTYNNFLNLNNQNSPSEQQLNFQRGQAGERERPAQEDEEYLAF